jgi:hypothetical protein
MLGRLGLDKVRNEFDEFDVDDDDVETFRRVDGDGGRSVREVSSDALPDNSNQKFNLRNKSFMLWILLGKWGKTLERRPNFVAFQNTCIRNNLKTN